MNIKTEKINNFIYSLTVKNGPNDVNVFLLKGKESDILIDTAYENRSSELKDVLCGISSNPLKLIINTHHHFDHIGGNTLYNCPIICHENARDRIAGSFYNLPPYLSAGVPDITVSSHMTVFHDSEEIQIKAMSPSHSDGDLIIYLKNKKTLIMGDLLFSQTLPFVDLNNGGDIHGEMNTYRDLLKRFPDAETILAGHGRALTVNQFKEYIEIIQSSVDLIEESLSLKKTKEEILGSEEYKVLLEQLDDGDKFAEMWIDSIIESQSAVPSLISPVTEIVSNQGINEAIKFYRENHLSRNYRATERDLNMLAYNLMFRNRKEEALKLFNLYVELHPESANSWDSLAECHMNMGDETKAREYYEKALKMDPERDYIQEILDKIGS